MPSVLSHYDASQTVIASRKQIRSPRAEGRPKSEGRTPKEVRRPKAEQLPSGFMAPKHMAIYLHFAACPRLDGRPLLAFWRAGATYHGCRRRKNSLPKIGTVTLIVPDPATGALVIQNHCADGPRTVVPSRMTSATVPGHVSVA